MDEELMLEFKKNNDELLSKVDLLTEGVITLTNEIKKVTNSAMVKQLTTMSGNEKALVGWMLSNNKRTFILTYHHQDWVKEVLASLVEKNIFVTALKVINSFSSGTFSIRDSAFYLLYSVKDRFEEWAITIKSEFDLYKEDNCDSLLCHANTFAKNFGMSEITAEQLTGNAPLGYEPVDRDKIWSNRKDVVSALIKDKDLKLLGPDKAMKK